MAADTKDDPITPVEALDSLPALPFDPEQAADAHALGRAELLQSVLAIARLDHVTESQLVRDAVRHALGSLPKVGD
jgi:hypothetical protein